MWSCGCYKTKVWRLAFCHWTTEVTLPLGSTFYKNVLKSVSEREDLWHRQFDHKKLSHGAAKHRPMLCKGVSRLGRDLIPDVMLITKTTIHILEWLPHSPLKMISYHYFHLVTVININCAFFTLFKLNLSIMTCIKSWMCFFFYLFFLTGHFR